MTNALTFDADENKQIDVTELVKLFNSNEMACGGMPRRDSEALTKDWALTPLAMLTVKNRLYVWENLDPDDFHVDDVISEADAKVGLLRWVAREFWKIKQSWAREYANGYASPLEMMIGLNMNRRHAWVFDLYLQGDRVILDFQYED